MARWQAPVVLAAVALGILVGLTTDIGSRLETLVVPSLVGLLVLTFAGVNLSSVASAVTAGRRTAAASLALNFVWAPACAGVLGWWLLSGDLDLRIGLVMLLVTPCTDWYLVFTSAAGGNVPLAAALLPVNLVLQLLLLPLFVVLLTGAAADIPIGSLAASVAVVLGVPVGAAAVIRLAAARSGRTLALDGLLARLEPLGLALLAAAVIGIFAAHAEVAIDEAATLGPLLAALAIFFVTTYGLAGGTASALRLAAPERVTLTITAMARNSPVALAVAATAFPHQPLVVVALVVGPLVELPVLSVVTRLHRGTGRRRAPSGETFG